MAKPSARSVLALALLGVFLYLSAGLLPWFLRNLRLQRFVEELAHSVSVSPQPGESIQAQVAERARQLGLPVKASDVQVESRGGSTAIRVRYVVEVSLPGYGVKLHFAPSGGS